MRDNDRWEPRGTKIRQAPMKVDEDYSTEGRGEKWDRPRKKKTFGGIFGHCCQGG